MVFSYPEPESNRQSGVRLGLVEVCV